MYPFLFVAALPGQFVENPAFNKAQQIVAFEATVRTYHPASRSIGTAVIVAQKDGKSYLLTAAHLVSPVALPERQNEDPERVEMFHYAAKKPDGVSSRGDAKVVARMPNVDLAVLEVELKSPPAAIPICPRDKRMMHLPMAVMTLGAIADGPPEIVFDQVEKKRFLQKPDHTEANYWEANIPQETGRSGGPMIDARGYLIGIASGIQNGKGYYSSTNEILHALDKERLMWLYQNSVPKK
jgi:S1-C subfamily serine protease